MRVTLPEMSRKQHDPRLEGAGWFENKVSEAKFSGFKQEVMQFRNEMLEFKTEIFEKIRRQGLSRITDRDNINDLEQRVTDIEEDMRGYQFHGYPNYSDDDEEAEEDAENVENISDGSSSSSGSDSEDSESDDDEDAQDAYYRRRLYDQEDEF